MSDWYDEEPRLGRLQMLVIGILVGALMLGLIWLALWWLSAPGEPETTGGSANDNAELVEGGGAGSPAVEDRLARCKEVYAAQQPALEQAAAAMDQWEVHIGAMNQLVTGAISLKQAWQFWNETREGAWQRLDAYAAADRRFDRRTARCPQPGRAAQVSDELRSCSSAVLARNRVLKAADRALGTWRTHVRHMDMLRRGDMTPARATAMWLQSWRQGDREVKAYRAAVRDTRGLGC